MGEDSELEQDRTTIAGWLAKEWAQFRWKVEGTFQPQDMSTRLLPGEQIQLEVHPAWYRNILGLFIFHRFRWALAITLIISSIVAVFFLLLDFNPLYIFIPIGLLAVLAIIAVIEHYDYLQWRLLKTNIRLIISVPQRGAWPLLDTIELKGLPNVLDTNWSPNPIWRVFQFFTGARDLYISLVGYQFIEGTARVRDALVIPDVLPRDVFELKKLVFQSK
jgi:hypothetical protein